MDRNVWDKYAGYYVLYMWKAIGSPCAFGLILQCKICCLFSFRITLSHAVVAVEIETEEEREETNGRRERNNFLYYFIGLYVKIRSGMQDVL